MAESFSVRDWQALARVSYVPCRLNAIFESHGTVTHRILADDLISCCSNLFKKAERTVRSKKLFLPWSGSRSSFAEGLEVDPIMHNQARYRGLFGPKRGLRRLYFV